MTFLLDRLRTSRDRLLHASKDWQQDCGQLATTHWRFEWLLEWQAGSTFGQQPGGFAVQAQLPLNRPNRSPVYHDTRGVCKNSSFSRYLCGTSSLELLLYSSACILPAHHSSIEGLWKPAKALTKWKVIAPDLATRKGSFRNYTPLPGAFGRNRCAPFCLGLSWPKPMMLLLLLSI